MSLLCLALARLFLFALGKSGTNGVEYESFCVGIISDTTIL